MKHIRAVCAAAIAGMLLLTGAAAVLHNKADAGPASVYTEPLAAAPAADDPLAHIADDYTVDAGFSTSLPLVVIDTGGVDPPISTELTKDPDGTWIYLPIDGVEPYVQGTISVIDSGTGENSLADAPAVESRMRIKRRGNSSMFYEKAQWLVQLETASGENNEVDVLGMGADHEWVLNGSMADKSMLRNYLAYSIASEFMPYTPEYRFCEVLLKNGGTYTYWGVYLLGENIRQGSSRLDIEDYHPSKAVNSYLVRRDRYDVDANLLNTYGRENGLYSEYLELLYPNQDDASQKMIDYVTSDISAFEQALYSDDPKVFATYKNYIDIDSFVDYFLLNEFFGSYDSGNYSTYFYKDLGGKLCMGPVWDFDGTMDNYRDEPLEPDKIAFQTKPWFDRLCQDEDFLDRLSARYSELRRTSFSEEHVIGRIDEIIAHLGGAQQREWTRWADWYTTDNLYSLKDYTTDDGEVLHRDAKTYDAEIWRIKTALREHGEAIGYYITLLERTAPYDTGAANWMGLLLALAAMVFLVPAYYGSFRK